jgi:hypothetical protein
MKNDLSYFCIFVAWVALIAALVVVDVVERSRLAERATAEGCTYVDKSNKLFFMKCGDKIETRSIYK